MYTVDGESYTGPSASGDLASQIFSFQSTGG